MSATIHSKVIDLDEMVPRIVSEECEEKDAERLIPWIFEQSQTASRYCTRQWPKRRVKFRSFFSIFSSHRIQPERSHTSILQASETITLPRRSWEAPTREPFAHFMKMQGNALRSLMKTIYCSLEGRKEEDHVFQFPMFRYRHKYFIGGQRYHSRSEGAVTTSSRHRAIPIISYVGWYEGQTWSEYLAEALTAMLGQLARNVRVPFRDQEVFIIGLYGPCLYIARGFFTADTISRVHRRGCSEGETVELQFTRNYNLTVKGEWVAVMRALTRLFRYLLSGNANVGGMKARCAQPETR